MNTSIEANNKALVLEAFEAAFNRRYPAAYDRYWSPKYLQHSARVPPGREGLRSLIAAQPKTLRYEAIRPPVRRG
jgi:predicted SnoaL-like aldol condensation-catalyzing enzyme